MCFCFQYLLVNKVCQMTGLVGLKGRTWHGFQMNAVLFLLWGTSLVPYLLKHKKATLIPTVPWSPGITIWVSESQISGSRLSALYLTGELADVRDLPTRVELSLRSLAVLLPECLFHEGMWERLRLKHEDPLH